MMFRLFRAFRGERIRKDQPRERNKRKEKRHKGTKNAKNKWEKDSASFYPSMAMNRIHFCNFCALSCQLRVAPRLLRRGFFLRNTVNDGKIIYLFQRRYLGGVCTQGSEAQPLGWNYLSTSWKNARGFGG